jgi:hypothetical protein
MVIEDGDTVELAPAADVPAPAADVPVLFEPHADRVSAEHTAATVNALDFQFANTGDSDLTGVSLTVETGWDGMGRQRVRSPGAVVGR